MQIEATEVFEKNYEALFNSDKRFIINQGGSRSSKTISICQLLILYALRNKNSEITIVRKTMPALRDSAMKDFFNLLKEYNLYNQKRHNKTENKYQFANGTIVKFMSVEEETRIRGIASDVVYCCEGNELWFDDYFQLNLRCRDKMIICFNPSDADNWIYNLPDNNKVVIKSTYKDNPFLGQAQINEIEALKETDEALYTIFALGERAATRQNIYQNWNWIEGDRPERFVDYVIGIDFGFVHPTAMVKIFYTQENEIYIEPILYESGLTGFKTAEKLEELGIDKNIDMVCDFARPEIMEELRNFGFNVMNANKSVDAGIDCVRRFKVFANEKDEDLKKEYLNYMYQKIKGQLTSNPVKMWDDFMDAIRYACMHIKKYYMQSQETIYYNS